MKYATPKEANELLLTAFGGKRPIDESLVKEFQRCLTNNTYDTLRWQLGERPGKYKKHDYITDVNNPAASSGSLNLILPKERGIDPRGIRRLSVPARSPGSLLAGINEICAAPELVHEKMSELLDEIIDIPDNKVLIVAAYFHAKFENTHHQDTRLCLCTYILDISSSPSPCTMHKNSHPYRS